MRMGIGIGWPNASAGVTPIIPKTGWFNIEQDCNETAYNNAWTQLLIDTVLQSGQYAYSTDVGTRVLLGTFSDLDPSAENTITIEGEGFNSCGV